MNMMDMFRRVCLIDIVRLACLSLSLEMMESDLRSTSRSISIGIYIYIYICMFYRRSGQPGAGVNGATASKIIDEQSDNSI